MDIAELSRKLENLIRIGTVAEVDHVAHRVRVASGDITTAWLKWQAGRAGETRTWSPPTVGEQVMILSPSGELANGIAMPSIYSDAADAPSSSATKHAIEFPDGATIVYDHGTHDLTAALIATATIQASDSVTVDCPQTTFTGAVTVQGLFTYQAGMQGTGGSGASAVIDGAIHATQDITSAGISLQGHHHTGVQPGGGNTGGPA